MLWLAYGTSYNNPQDSSRRDNTNPGWFVNIPTPLGIGVDTLDGTLDARLVSS